MRVLLAVAGEDDAVAASDHVAACFDADGIDIDVLSVAERGGAPAQSDPAALAAVRLGETHGFRRVRVRARVGRAVDEIVVASEELRSALVLLCAPRRRGLLTAFGIGSVARGVAARARCPVELVRTGGRPEARLGRPALVVLDVERLDEFPFEELRRQSTSWRARSTVTIVAVQRDALEGCSVDVNPAALLRSLERGDDDRAWSEARLDRVCGALASALDGRLSVDRRIVVGHTHDVALAGAEQLGASLLVLDSPASDRSLRGSFSGLSRAALTMAAPCSVLLLRGAPRANAREEQRAAQPVQSLP